MPKASSPVRLQRQLMESAARVGSRHHRSAAEQIEYWATLGRQVAHLLDPDSILDVAAASVSPVEVFAAVDAGRSSPQLAQAVTTAGCRYQACPDHPGYLEQIRADGSRCVGLFRDGSFYPVATPSGQP